MIFKIHKIFNTSQKYYSIIKIYENNKKTSKLFIKHIKSKNFIHFNKISKKLTPESHLSTSEMIEQSLDISNL